MNLKNQIMHKNFAFATVDTTSAWCHQEPTYAVHFQ